MRNDAEKLIALLGQPSDHPEVRGSLDHLKILRKPAVWYATKGDEDSRQTQDFVVNRRLGIDCGFEDRASFLGEHLDEIGKGTMLLTQLYFYCDHPEVQAYGGDLPFGLIASDGRAEVRQKMIQWEATRRSYLRDVWELPEYRVTASYVDEGARLGYLAFFRRPPVVPADDDDTRILPSAGGLFGCLGKPIANNDLRALLRPLRFEPLLEEFEDGLVADFSDRFGLELYFDIAGGRSEMSLTRVVFLRDDSASNPCWPLDLPNGISFEHSPDQVFQNLGAPKAIGEGEFDGEAVWHLPTHDVLVAYSTMENLVLAVEIMVHGIRS